jgi:hypothetical protein
VDEAHQSIGRQWLARGACQDERTFAEDARDSCKPRLEMLNQVLSYWVASGSPEASEWVEEILIEVLPVQPNVLSFRIAIQACLRGKELDCVDTLIDRISAAGKCLERRLDLAM